MKNKTKVNSKVISKFLHEVRVIHSKDKKHKHLFNQQFPLPPNGNVMLHLRVLEISMNKKVFQEKAYHLQSINWAWAAERKARAGARERGGPVLTGPVLPNRTR